MCHSGVRLKTGGAAAALVLLTLTPAGQKLSPGEVRISSGPYRPQSRILRAESRLVQVEVIVRDSRGHAVSGLAKDDFAVFDSGHPRDIAEFSTETANAASGAQPGSSGAPVPSASMGQPSAPKQLGNSVRWIGLFFDDINTPPGDLGRAKIAAMRFIGEGTQAGDHIGLFTTSGGQILSFTSDTGAVLRSVATVHPHPRIDAAGIKPCPRITPYDAYQIINNDAITLQAKVLEACSCPDQPECDWTALSTIRPSDLSAPSTFARSSLVRSVVAQAQATWDHARMISQTTLHAVRAAVEQLSHMLGKRILLFSSSGLLTGDLGAQVHEIINEALRADVVINSLDSKGLYAETPGRPLSEVSQTLPDLTMVYEEKSLGDKLESEDSAMASFAESTGGLLFRNNNDLDYGFRELGLAPTYAYVLGFAPDEDGKYHKIKVELRNGSHDFVQARPGYFAPTTASSESRQSTVDDKIDAEMRGTEERSDFPITISEKSSVAGNGGGGLKVDTHVDIQKLPFEKQNDRHTEMLTFVAALYDGQGHFVTGKEAQIQLALKPDTFARFSKEGIGGKMTLEAPRGKYRLRVVVQEAVKGEMAATSKMIQIP